MQWSSLSRLLLTLSLLASAGEGGCVQLGGPAQQLRPTPSQPVWSMEELARHVRFFNSPEVEGRGTGTQGFARAAAYIAARMSEFGLQPVLHGEFRLMYHLPLNHPTAAVLATLGADTLFLYPGDDFLPDSRSDSGTLEIHRLVVDPDGAEGPPGLSGRGQGLPEAVVLLSSEKAGSDYLRQVQAAGARAVLIAGPLMPRQAAAPLEGLAVMQVTPEAAAHLLGTTAADVSARLRGGERFAWPLPQPGFMRIVTEYQLMAGAMNTMGYVAGRHPARARELVIVCSGLDAAGQLGGVWVMDFTQLGAGTAALLEVARNYASFAPVAEVPERTILFAAWSGSRLGHRGLQAFLERPIWDLERIHAVIYIGLRPEEEPSVRALLAGYGLPLYVVSAPETPPPGRDAVLLPSADRSRRTPERARRVTPSASQPDLSDVLDQAVLAARDLAAETHEVLLSEIVTPAPFRPTFEDTLRVPPGPGEEGR